MYLYDKKDFNRLRLTGRGQILINLKATKEKPVTYLQIALADNKAFWYFPALS